MKNKLSAIESKIHYHFKDQKLLILSMTHSSFAYEIQSGEHQDNEVLEFLGDSVLGLVVADYLFTTYTGLSEGELSKLKAAVENTSSLSLFAKEIKLHQYLFLGKGEEKAAVGKKGPFWQEHLKPLSQPFIWMAVSKKRPVSLRHISKHSFKKSM